MYLLRCFDVKFLPDDWHTVCSFLLPVCVCACACACCMLLIHEAGSETWKTVALASIAYSTSPHRMCLSIYLSIVITSVICMDSSPAVMLEVTPVFVHFCKHTFSSLCPINIMWKMVIVLCCHLSFSRVVSFYELPPFPLTHLKGVFEACSLFFQAV